ncbi:MAG: hypothetical protein SFU98_10870 [Leptospiraceae bacterium]|nr:hypothetical protein [Leptospiraceae bacterium]
MENSLRINTGLKHFRMVILSLVLSILLLGCENINPKKDNPNLPDGDLVYFWGFVLGCFFPKGAEFCNSANSVKLITPSETKCGKSFQTLNDSSSFIYDESNKRIQVNEVPVNSKLQCKIIDSSNKISSDTTTWYKLDSSLKFGTLIFTHRKLSDTQLDFFTATDSGEVLLCCNEKLIINQGSCNETYWQITCNQIKIQ